jgi:hypothetical protein
VGYAPVEAATKNGIAVQKYRDEYSLKVAVDYSPHSHLWQVMKPVKENNPTESSTTEIDGEKVCNFITAWGDGLFPVYRDFALANSFRYGIEMEPTASHKLT